MRTCSLGIDSGSADLTNRGRDTGHVVKGVSRRFNRCLPWNSAYIDGSTATLVHNLAGPAFAPTVNEVLRATLARVDVARIGRPTRACA